MKKQIPALFWARGSRFVLAPNFPIKSTIGQFMLLFPLRHFLNRKSLQSEIFRIFQKENVKLYPTRFSLEGKSSIKTEERMFVFLEEVDCLADVTRAIKDTELV